MKEAAEELARQEEEDYEYYGKGQQAQTREESVEAYDPQSEEVANIEEHKSVYGEADWQKVLSTETALQSNFIKFCDTNSPTLWPCLPLNLGCGASPPKPTDQANDKSAQL